MPPASEPTGANGSSLSSSRQRSGVYIRGRGLTWTYTCQNGLGYYKSGRIGNAIRRTYRRTSAARYTCWSGASIYFRTSLTLRSVLY